MGRGCTRVNDEGVGGSSSKPDASRESDFRAYSHRRGARAGSGGPPGPSSQTTRVLRSRRPYRLVDEDDDAPRFPLAEVDTGVEQDVVPELDTEARLEAMLDERVLPPPSREANRLTRTMPLTKYGDELFHKTTYRVLDAHMSRQMSLTIQGRVKGVWPSWKFVPRDVKNLMCTEWMDLYDFRPDDLSRARNAFMTSAPDLYKQMMKRARDRAKLFLKTSYMDMIETGRPQWLDKHIWERLCREYWMTVEWQKMAETNKANRLKSKDGGITRHTCGTTQKLGRRATIAEVFDMTHRADKGKGLYKDKKSEDVAGRYKERMLGKYGKDTSTHTELDENAYRYAVGKANRGIVYGLGSTTMNALRLPAGSEGGSSRGSCSSQSTDRGPTLQQHVVHAIDPDVISRLELIEERMQSRSTVVDSTHIKSVVRDIIQGEMQTIRAKVIDHVTSHVASNIMVDVAQRVSDIVSERLNTKFITELLASEERQKKQRIMENQVWDNSLIHAMKKNIRPQEGDSQDDDTQPPPDLTR